jgi:hypothetical protein
MHFAFCRLHSSHIDHGGSLLELPVISLILIAGAGLPLGLHNHMKGEVLSPFVGPIKKTIVGLLVFNQGVTLRRDVAYLR